MTDSRSLSALAKGLRNGAFSATELTAAVLKRARDDQLNAFCHIDDEHALDAAHEADERLRAHSATALTGIPFAVKDIFCELGRPATCSSKILNGFVAPYEATATGRLKQAGAVSVGRTNMDEFAMGSSGENGINGPIGNPWDKSRVPGGSSGGSAAAVGAGTVPFALGTDTGGSVRQPASFCGITGLKPSYGRVSRFGMIAYASSLDCAGVLAESALDCALVLGEMAGLDAQDATSSARPVDDYVAALERTGIDGMTIGLPRAYWSDGIESEVADQVMDACKHMERLGARLVDIDIGASDVAVACYYLIASAEASSNLSRFDGVRYGHRASNARKLDELYRQSRTEGFGAEVKRRILTGTYALSAGYYDEFYGRAQRVRRVIVNAFADAFTEVDLIAAPVTPTTAFGIGEKVDDPIAMYQSDINTVAVSLAGLPALSLPAGLAGGMPVGMQLIAPLFSEASLLGAGHALQKATAWHLERPRC